LLRGEERSERKSGESCPTKAMPKVTTHSGRVVDLLVSFPYPPHLPTFVPTYSITKGNKERREPEDQKDGGWQKSHFISRTY
jgi:hypothetical protein